VKGETPPALLSRPVPHDDAAPYFEAFHALSPSRNMGFESAGAIPVGEILAYCELIGLKNDDDRRLMLRFVRVLDNAYLKAVKKNDGATNKPSRRRR